MNFHRTRSTLLIAAPSQTVSKSIAFTTVRRNDSGVWQSTCPSPWSCSTSMIPIIAALPLEALDAFLLIAYNRKTSKAMLQVLTVNGMPMSACSLSEVFTFIACADFDQNRKDLLVALDGGRVQSYAMRLTTEGRGDAKVQVVHAIFRRQIQLSKAAGKTPLQITTGDVSSATLLLSRGGITCLDTGSLDKLWFIPSSTFIMPPMQLWMDRFGSDFMVLCRSQRGDGSETLEYWNAPITFAQAEAGSFSRVVVPISSDSTVVDLSFESVGGRYGTMLCVLLSSGRVQLWRPLRAQGDLMLDSEISLAGQFDLKMYAVSSRAVPIGPETTGTTHGPGMPLLRRSPLPGRSVMQFASSAGTPDCPVSLLAACNSDVCCLAMHAPQAVESACQRTLLDLTFMQHPDQGWDEEEDCLARFQLGTRLQPVNRTRLLHDQKGSPQPPQYLIGNSNAVFVLDDEDDDNGGNVSDLGTVQGSGILSKYIASPHNSLFPPSRLDTESHHSVQLRLPMVEGRTYTPSTRNGSPIPSRGGSPSTGNASPSSPGGAMRGGTGYLSVQPYEEFQTQQSFFPIDDAVGSLVGIGDAAMDSLVGPGLDAGLMSEFFSKGKALSLNSLVNARAGLSIESGFSPPRSMDADNDNVSLGSNKAGSLPDLGYTNPPTSSVNGHISINLLPTTTTSNILLDMGVSALGVSAMARPPRLAPPAAFPAMEKPSVSFFYPARILPCLDAGSTDLPNMADGISMLRVVTPSLVALSRALGLTNGKAKAASAPSTVQTSTTMAFLSRYGLQASSRDVDIAKTLTYSMLGVAYRSGAMATMTNLKEAFMFDLRHLNKAPVVGGSLRMEFDMRQSSVATVMAVVDVNLYVHRVAEEGKPRMTCKSSSQKDLGNDYEEILCSLCLVGDTDGKVHFAVGSVARGSLQCGAIAAHTSAVRCIVATGDACRPMWRVGVQCARFGQAASSGNTYSPHPCPGSAIVSIAVDGEVKVWQPVFVSTATPATRSDQVLTASRLEWRMAGLFSCQRGSNQGPRSSVTSACLDPSCMFVLIGRSNGVAEQWPLPGLVSSSGLHTTQASLWTLSRHAGAITDCQVFVHAIDTGMKQIDVPRETDADGADVALSSKIVCSVRPQGANKASSGPAGGTSTSAATAVSEKTVGYTLEELRGLAGSSSLCTCSTDLSIVLWRFLVSRDGEGDWSASRWSSAHNSRYLYPLPCRRFVFSSPPSKGLCFPPTPPVPSATAGDIKECIWRLGAIVNGIVVTAMQSSFNTLFATDENMLEHACLGDGRPVGESISELLQMMPVLTQVFKPSRTAELLSQRAPTDGSHGTFSWQSLDYWREKEGDPVPPQPRLDPQYEDGDGGEDAAGPFDLAPKAPQGAFASSGPAPPSLSETNIVVPLGPDVVSEKNQAALTGQQKAMLGDVRVVVPLPDSGAGSLGRTLGPRELEAAMQPDASGARKRFMPYRKDNIADGPQMPPPFSPFADFNEPGGGSFANGTFEEVSRTNDFVEMVPPTGSVLHPQRSLDTFPSTLLVTMTPMEPLAPLAPESAESAKFDDFFTDDLTVEDSIPIGSRHRSPSSIMSAQSGRSTELRQTPSRTASLAMTSEGIVGVGSPNLSQAGFGTRSIEIPMEGGHNLRLRRVKGEDGAISSELVLSTRIGAAIDLPFPSSESDPSALEDNNKNKAAAAAVVVDRRTKRDKELEFKLTHAQVLRQEKQKKLRERMQAEEKSKVAKAKTLYVSKSHKDLKEKEKPVTRQVMGSSVPFAVPLNFSEEAMRLRAQKTVVDKGVSKARKDRKAEVCDGEADGGATNALKAPAPFAQLVADKGEEKDELQGDDFYQDPEYNIPNVAAPAPGAISRTLRMSKIGIVLQEPPPGEDGEVDGSVRVVLEEGEFVADIPTYFDRNAKQSFVYDRKDNARPPRRTFVPKRPGTGPHSRPGTVPGEEEAENTDEAEAMLLMGAGFNAELLTTEDKVVLCIVLNEFNFADLDQFEGMDSETKLLVLREMAAVEPEEGQVPAEHNAMVAKRGVAAMKRLLTKMRSLKAMIGGAGMKNLLGKAGGAGALPGADVMLEVKSYTQKTVKLGYLTSNTKVRIVVFAMLADHDSPLTDPPRIVPGPGASLPPAASGSVDNKAAGPTVAGEGSLASSAYSIKSGSSRPASKVPPPMRLELITLEELLQIPGICSGVVMTIKDDEEPAMGGTVIPSVKPDETSVSSAPPAAAAPASPAAPADEPNEVTLRNLDPSRSYKIYCYIACSSTGKRTFRRMTADDMKVRGCNTPASIHSSIHLYTCEV